MRFGGAAERQHSQKQTDIHSWMSSWMRNETKTSGEKGGGGGKG